MIEPLLIILTVLVAAALILLIVVFARGSAVRDLPRLDTRFTVLERNQEKFERTVKEEMAHIRGETAQHGKELREELNNALKLFSDSLFSRMNDISNLQKNQLDIFSKQLESLTRTNEMKLNVMRETVEERLRHLQEDNAKKLELMRATVDEKLHATLERRLGESFKLVSERLELVHKGLGEMHSLASSVGDLKKVLTNVKTRGTWGEIQLGSLLEQVLTKEQYDKNVAVKKGTNERVEYAIKLPGKDVADGNVVWLPIDAKFPQEDYQKLMIASEQGDAALVDETSKQLEARIKTSAKEIKTKYIDPPATTDFAVMFLPVEGLYAEVLRRPGLCERLQQEYRVVVAGPTTLSALLNSLQMGFRTLAIEKRSSEVWALLGAVKTEFGKFGDILEKTRKKIKEAGDTIDTAARKSRTIERKLKDVQELPSTEAVTVLPHHMEEKEG